MTQGNKKKIMILDSTLRDGAQGEGISFSVSDKINIVKALDNLGVDYIEAGNPFSNPKDIEFFKKLNDVKLKHSRIAAFGSTRRRDVAASEDANVISLLGSGAPVVVIFGKSWDFHVTEIIRASLDENINMISDTVGYLKSNGKEVIYDAEHFFDGYKANPEYALKTLKAAETAGADSICLCDTNGGCFTDEIAEITRKVVSGLKVPVGIHTHNDSEMAVANSIAAVGSGASQIQGTLIGIGERCGNANLSSIIGSLQMKREYTCIPDENLKLLTQTARQVAEIANVTLFGGMAYVGKSAFTHKAGMHIDGVNKASSAFEHVQPENVGNHRRFLMSEVAGRSTVIERINKFDKSVTKDNPVTARIIDDIKKLEFEGYQFEGADASFELLIMKHLGKYKPLFTIEKFKTIAEQTFTEEYSLASAIVKVSVGGSSEMTAAEGDGPVNALDIALRKALERFYPQLKEFYLVDYKVRILDSKKASSAVTRVLIESTDSKDVWTTVGVSQDIIEASMIALVDAIEYKLFKDKNRI